VGVFLSPLSFFIVNIALPTICLDLAATPGDVQLVVSGYLSAYAVFLITGGRLGDLYGRKPVFLAGVAVFGFSSALCGLASSPATLVAGRILQGGASAIMVPQALGSIHDLFPIDERPFALGVYGAVLGLAAIGGQTYGGALVSADPFGLGWRLVFLANIPVVLVTLAFSPLLRDTRRLFLPSERLDLVGVSLLALTLALLIVPLIEGRAAGRPLWAFAMLLASPIVAALFWRHEVRVLREGGAPLVDPRIACTPGLHWGVLALLTFYATSIFFVSFSVYLQSALGKNPLAAGMAFLPFGVGSFVGPLVSPYASKIFGSASAPLAMILETIGFLSLAAITWTTPNSASNPGSC
jgi:MFS family permease